MTRILSAFLLTTLLFSNAFGQNKDTANVNLTNFKLFNGTFSWRGTGTYYDMTAWDSSPFTEGTLMQKSGSNWLFRLNYRLLFPGGKADKSGWDPSYKPGYPMIVFLHGGGERGNCWNGQCYCGTNNGCNVNGTPIPGTDARFLNNDNVLSQGGQTHLSSVVLAGTKKPDDVTLDGRAFPGFLFYPQNVNAWGNDNSGSSDLSYAIRTVRLLIRQYNIDPNRIYIHGLSLGGQGVYKAMNMCDWLWACAASMSGLDYQNGLEYDSVANIPLWVFQGGQDVLVTPSQSQSLVKKFRQAGGDARYTLYPTLGHGTWNAAYAEPDFFTWLLSNNKSNIHVPFGNPNICGSNGAGVKLTLAQGFLAYQWEQDGKIVPGATSYTYLTTVPGVYRARFSRVSTNPQNDSQWNRWSDPVTIGEKTPDVPVINQVGTVVLSDLNNNKNATLNGPDGFEHYYWFKNGATSTLPDQQTASIAGCAATTSCANTGAYSLVTAGFDLCPSPQSQPKYVILGVNNSAITPPVITNKPSNLVGKVTSPSSILLTWSDNSRDERGYEIWRRTSTDASTTPWKMAVLTTEDITQFHDVGLTPNTTYYYKIRAVNNSGRSDYYPGNSPTTVAQHFVISTGLDTTIPTPPQNLIAVATAIQTVKLTWGAATDESGIKDYVIYFGTDSVDIGSNATTYTLTKTKLALNTLYNFTVRAIDTYGNRSTKSNQVTASTYVDGLFYEHSTGAWTKITDFAWTTAVPEFTGHVNNITLAGPPPAGPRTQDDYFNFKFYGYLYIVKAGTYTFRLSSNDGSQLLVDGTSRITRTNTVVDGTCSSSTGSALTFAANSYHYIELRYFDYTGSQCLTLEYKGPDTGTKTPYIVVPDNVLKSYNTITPPTPPIAVTNLTATATSMTQINLAWTFGGVGTVNYEVYRSTVLNGTYAMIGRVSTTSLQDANLVPNTTYYYKIKTVSDNGTSPFSAVANAKTLSDAIAPTVPTALASTASTFTTVSLVWTASTDNVLVTGYEIWANGQMIGTSAIPGYLATALTPNTSYSFYVVAYDASGNKSTASSTINTSTSTADVYYSKAAGALNVPGTWGKNTDGSGILATTFANNGQYFVVSNRTTSSLGGQWSVDGSISKVIVPNGVTLTVDNVYSGHTEVQGTGTVNVNSASVPQFTALSPTSTVNYNYSSLGVTYIQQNTYGNLGLYGPGNKVFASGTTTVVGNIIGNVGVAFKGAPNNKTKLIVQGDINITGAPGFTAPDFGIDLELAKVGVQNITAGGDLYFEKVSTTGTGNVTTLLNGGSVIKLNVGTYNGGGLSIAAGTTFNLNANSVVLDKNASINGSGETGRIATNGGTIDITTTSGLNSNLYFDPVNNKAARLALNASGAGKMYVKETMSVTSGIKIKNGELNAGGNITLLSDASGTANIEQIEGSGVITGNMNVQRYLDAKGKIYRYISTAVSGTTVATWQNFFPITGNFTGYSTGYTTNPSMYIYDHGAWTPYPPTGGTNLAPIVKGRGYSAFLRNGATPITMQATGNPYQGNVVFTIDPDPSASATDGWSLVGNPYASTIAWNNTAWTMTGVNSSISVRDNPTGDFKYYDWFTGLGTLAGGKVAPGQAFWVQAITATPSLTITEAAKVTAQQTIYREATTPVSHITISMQQGTLEDAAFIAFTDVGSDGFDDLYDAVKQQNTGMFNFSSLTTSNVATAINNMSNGFCSKTLALNIQPATPVANGSYNLVVKEIEALEAVGQITLKDNFTHTTTVLNSGSVYTFNVVATDATSYGSGRFTLTLSRPNLNLNSIASAAENICDVDSAVVKLSNTQAGVDYYATINNLKVSSTVTGNGSDINLVISKDKLTQGNNIIELVAGFKGCGTQSLPSNVTVAYATSPVITTEQSLTGCQGATTTLTASGVPAGGTYKWYDSQGNVISGATGSSFETSVLVEQNLYYVSGLTASGCEGPKLDITIDGQFVDKPLLAVENDTLIATANTAVTWYRNGKPLADSIGTYFVPVANGIYSVVSVVNGCESESDPIEFIVTGVETVDGAMTLSAFPNPSTIRYLTITVKSIHQDDIVLELVDMLGRNVYSHQLSSSDAARGHNIRTASPLKSGVYTLMATQGARSLQQRIVILD